MRVFFESEQTVDDAYPAYFFAGFVPEIESQKRFTAQF